MIADSRFYQTTAVSTLGRIIARPTFLKVVKPALVGALIGGFSGSANLGVLSASATVGLGLLDPTYAKRTEMITLRDRQSSLEEFTEGQLNQVNAELAHLRKAVHPRGRVAVFVDGSNLHISAVNENTGRIDYDKLFNCFKQGASELAKVMFFTGVDRANLAQQGFFGYLRRLNHPIEIIGKAVAHGEGSSMREKGIDTEIVLKMVELMDEYDTAVLITGDGDMLGAVQRVQQKGRRVEVVGFPSSMSRVLREAADEFIDISQLKVFG